MDGWRETMEKLAEALLELDWSDMDAFAQFICDITVSDEAGDDIDPRSVAACLVDWANERIGDDADAC